MTRLSRIKISELPETVTEMWIGELLFGIICEMLAVWFVNNKFGFTIGICGGTLLAIFNTYHMWWVLDRSFDMDENKAGKYAGAQYGIRYALLIVLVAVLYLTGWGNAFAAFAAYMGIKVAAYIQPFIHKLIRR